MLYLKHTKLLEDDVVTKGEVAPERLASIEAERKKLRASSAGAKDVINSNVDAEKALDKKEKQVIQDARSGNKQVQQKPKKITESGDNNMSYFNDKKQYEAFYEAMKIVLEEGERLGILNGEYLKEDNSYDPLNEASFSKASSVRMSKEARRNWLQSRAAIAAAKAHNDPNYAKLCKANRMRREAIDAIKQKYSSVATKKAKEMIKSYKLTTSMTSPKVAAKPASSTSARIQTPKRMK